MIILALDTASYTTGYAIYKNGAIMSYGSIKLKGKGATDTERTQDRISQLYAKVRDLISKHEITQIVAEDIFRDSDPKKKSAVEVLAMCRGAVIAANTEKQLLPIQYINPLRVKNYMWGYTSSRKDHREMSHEEHKARMCRAVERLGYILNTDRKGNKDNDTADAIGILITYLKGRNIPVKHPNTK